MKTEVSPNRFWLEPSTYSLLVRVHLERGNILSTPFIERVLEVGEAKVLMLMRAGTNHCTNCVGSRITRRRLH